MNKNTLLHVALAAASVLDYDKLIKIRELKEYCTPYYARPATKDKLKKVIVVFRHGDRAPLSLHGNEWEKKRCVTCKSSECLSTKCSAGLLTVHGFQQGKNLGKFIKNNYKNLLKEDGGIKGYCSYADRTKATLSAVLGELDAPQTPHQVEKTLILGPECAGFRNKLADNKGVTMDYGVFDNYMTSVCGRVPIECDDANCQFKTAKSSVLTNYSNYTTIIENIRKDIVMNAAMFSDFSETILRELNGQASIVLMAAHDSTVSRLLSGLNIQVFNVPSYASAVFLEVLENSQGMETVRVVYNGVEQGFGTSNKTRMGKEDFIDYLLNFSGTNDAFRGYCTDFNSPVKEGNEKYKDLLLTAFNPEFLNSFEIDGGAEVVPVKVVEQKDQKTKNSGGTIVALSEAVDLISSGVSHLISVGKEIGQNFLFGSSKKNNLANINSADSDTHASTKTEGGNIWDGINNLIGLKNNLLGKKKKSSSSKKDKKKKNDDSECSSSSSETASTGDNKCKCERESCESDACKSDKKQSNEKCNCPSDCPCMSQGGSGSAGAQSEGCNCALNNKKKKNSCEPKKKKKNYCSEGNTISGSAFKNTPHREYAVYDVVNPQQCNECVKPTPVPIAPKPCTTGYSPCPTI